MLVFKVITHFVGNITKWLFYLGKKSIDEVVKDDNYGLGLIVILIIVLILFAYK